MPPVLSSRLLFGLFSTTKKYASKRCWRMKLSSKDCGGTSIHMRATFVKKIQSEQQMNGLPHIITTNKSYQHMISLFTVCQEECEYWGMQQQQVFLQLIIPWTKTYWCFKLKTSHNQQYVRETPCDLRQDHLFACAEIGLDHRKKQP